MNNQDQSGAPIHLMIRDGLPPEKRTPGGGTAAYACDPDVTRGVNAPMPQRTLDPARATCSVCLGALPTYCTAGDGCPIHPDIHNLHHPRTSNGAGPSPLFRGVMEAAGHEVVCEDDEIVLWRA